MVDLFKRHPVGVALFTGEPVMYYHIQLVLQTLVAVLVAAPILARVHERGKGLPKGFAMAMLRWGNPVRLIASIYNVYVIRIVRPRSDDDGNGVS